MYVLIHYSIKSQLAFNPHYQSCERRAWKERMRKCLPGEEVRAGWKMRDGGDIRGSGQFLITKVLISVAKGFIEIRGRKEERMNGVLWKECQAIFCTSTAEGGQGKKGGWGTSRGWEVQTTKHDNLKDGQMRRACLLILIPPPHAWHLPSIKDS